jgi:hypothetical protein
MVVPAGAVYAWRQVPCAGCPGRLRPAGRKERAVEIGRPVRTRIVEPLEDPVPKEAPTEPVPEPTPQEPAPATAPTP